MSRIAIAIVFALGLLIGMFVLMEVGRALGHRRLKEDEENARAGLGAIEGAVFALLGLLIAFTFTGAAARFDARRELIDREVNAIGSAWMRLDILEPAARAKIQGLMRADLDQRLAAYAAMSDRTEAFAELGKSEQVQMQIWDAAVAAAAAEPGKPVTLLLLPALNEMFDTAKLRTLAMEAHPPIAVYVLLGALALVSALLAGFGMSRGRRSWVHITVFAVVMAGSVYIIMDLEYPRSGLIQIKAFDQALIDLRTSMGQTLPNPGVRLAPDA